VKGYQELLKKLSAIVHERNLQPGDRLPPERVLAPLLGVSRNTLRNVLHKLEACRLVSIRKGSGTFLHTCLLEFEDVQESSGHDSERQMAERNESSYLILPIVAAQSAENIGVRSIDKLQQANIALSRSLLSGATPMIYDDVLSFFRILAQGTNNQYLVTVVEHLFAYSDLLGTMITRLTQEQRNKLFASHVKLIHALRERDRGHAAEIMKRYILFFSHAAEGHCNVKATDLVFAAMQEYEGDWS